MTKSADESGNKKYGAEQIQVLKGLEAVRKRPGMYIGSTSERGLHHLGYEVVDSSIDEAGGFADNVRVAIHRLVTVGTRRSIPWTHPTEDAGSGAHVLHAAASSTNSYKVSGGLRRRVRRQRVVEISRCGSSATGRSTTWTSPAATPPPS